MSVYKSIPMSPGALPQQRLYLVPDIGSTPDNISISSSNPGRDGIPRKLPRSATPIAQVEWAWSPMHNRIDSYHISMDTTRSRWVFWHSYFDDNCFPWRWVVAAATSTPRAGLSKKQAAAALLQHYWLQETEDMELDHYHWINDADLLDIGEVAEIARSVWEDPQTSR
jgi:hypothetical protein